MILCHIVCGKTHKEVDGLFCSVMSRSSTQPIHNVYLAKCEVTSVSAALELIINYGVKNTD